MTYFELRRLDEVSADALWEVLRNPKIAKHMPLHDGSITREWVTSWVTSKMSQWTNPMAGPWAISVGNEIIGWGGYQPDGERVELALVLLPAAWGMGRGILAEIDRRWQQVGDARPRVMYLPPSRRAEWIAQSFDLAVLGTTLIGDIEFTVLGLD